MYLYLAFDKYKKGYNRRLIEYSHLVLGTRSAAKFEKVPSTSEYRAICFFKKKTEDRDLQYSEKENVIPDKQTEFPFSDSAASVEEGE